MPRFFVLGALAGLGLWLTAPAYPFEMLAKLITGASLAGLVVSLTYVHEFMPWQWRAKIVALRRLWRAVH